MRSPRRQRSLPHIRDLEKTIYSSTQPYNRPEYDDNMIRERVSITGVVRPMEPENEMSMLHLNKEDLGVIKEAPVKRYLAGSMSLLHIATLERLAHMCIRRTSPPQRPSLIAISAARIRRCKRSVKVGVIVGTDLEKLRLLTEPYLPQSICANRCRRKRSGSPSAWRKCRSSNQRVPLAMARRRQPQPHDLPVAPLETSRRA